MPSDTDRTVVLPDDPDSAFQLLASLNPEKSPEEIIADSAAVYWSVIRSSLPELSLQEWRCVAEALGADWKITESHILMLADDVAAAMDERELARTWGVDGEHLKDVLSQLPFADRMAVGEVTEMFWMSHSKGDYTQVLRAILSRLSTPA